MANTILKELPALIKAGIITEDTARQIERFYQSNPAKSQNRLMILFGILGAVLVGLGIILIIAHNWDELPKSIKLFFAFLPLIGGQLLCGYSLFKKPGNTALRESAASFVFFAAGSCIALVSQVYNIPGNLSSFLLTWMLVCLPLLFVMQSSMVSLLYIAGITYYATELGYWGSSAVQPYLYWLLLLPALWYYFRLYLKNPSSNFIIFHNWIIPLSVTIVLGTLAHGIEELIVPAYVCLFSLLYLIGESSFLSGQRTRNNGYLVLGSLGTIFVLLLVSFDWYWQELQREHFRWSELLRSTEFYTIILLAVPAGLLLYFNNRNTAIKDVNPMGAMFILFIITFIVAFGSPALATILVNILVFLAGIFTLRKGSKADHLGILNYGLLIIAALVICRFFDTNLSFVIRGLLFISVGIGFFVANNQLLKKRRLSEK